MIPDEYVTPNYENIYPDDITKYIKSISLEAHFGESYFVTITGDKANGHTVAIFEETLTFSTCPQK